MLSPSLTQKYRINPELLAAVGGIEIKDKLITGEEMLIPIPTRTYTVRHSDTLGSIATRFGIRREALLGANPQLMGCDGVYDGQVLTLRYENMGLGMAAAVGYLSPSCKKEKLISALPYLTYVAFCYGGYNGRTVNIQGGFEQNVKAVKDSGKIPLLRVFDRTGGDFLNDKNTHERLCCELVEISQRYGFSGVIFASYQAAKNMSEAYADFIVKIRRQMIGCELIFLCEFDEGAKSVCCELSDGGILVPGGDGGFNTPTAEQEILSAFAEGGESSKIFVDLPSYATMENQLIPLCEARRLILRARSEIEKDPELNLSFAKTKNYSLYFEGIERTKAKLTEIGELGYMGVSFDIENAPVWQMMLFYNMFTPVGFSTVCPCG